MIRSMVTEIFLSVSQRTGFVCYKLTVPTKESRFDDLQVYSYEPTTTYTKDDESPLLEITSLSGFCPS